MRMEINETRAFLAAVDEGLRDSEAGRVSEEAPDHLCVSCAHWDGDRATVLQEIDASAEISPDDDLYSQRMLWGRCLAGNGGGDRVSPWSACGLWRNAE